MVVWRGWGLLVVIEFAIIFASIREMGLGEPITGLSAGVLAAVVIWFTGRWFNNPAKDREVIDTQTGEQIRLANRHTLFWIPMEWWAVPVALFGAVLAFGVK